MQSDVECLRIFPSTFVNLMVISSKYFFFFFLIKNVSKLEHIFLIGVLYHHVPNAGMPLREKRGGKYEESGCI